MSSRGSVAGMIGETVGESEPAGSPLLAVTELRKSFGGIKAVRDVGFTAHSGLVTAIIGPNGAGKTTVFNLISGFIRADGGHVLYRGEEITMRSPDQLARSGIVRTFQTAKLFESMTVRESVATAAMRTTSWPGALERADTTLALLQCESLSNHYPHQLSLPDRQMASLAMCIAPKPQLVLLDEVMGGLNRAEATRPIKVIGDLVADGVGVLMIEHVMPIVMELATKVVVMDFGKVICSGTPEEVVSNPEVQRSYLGDSL